jgi:hypothetical protein
VEVQSGPDNLIFEKYSNVMNLIFVGLTFGVGMPILFPVTLGCLIEYYLIERILTVFYYRKPDMIDDEVNNTALDMMPWGIVLYVANGYWMFSNKQIFSNEVYPKNSLTDAETTGHSIFKIKPDHAFGFFMFALFISVVVISQWLINLIKRYVYRDTKVAELLSVENLPNYFNCLFKKDIDWWLNEEKYIR